MTESTQIKDNNNNNVAASGAKTEFAKFFEKHKVENVYFFIKFICFNIFIK